MRALSCLAITALFLGLSGHSAAAASNRTRGGVWLDACGNAINAHGGSVLHHGGRYFWYGERKGPGKDGNRAHGVAVSCYSSDDLLQWRAEGPALEIGSHSDLKDGCIIERPKVVFCPATGKFVMYFHFEPVGRGYTAARVGVATSDSATNIFRLVETRRPNAGVWPQGFSADRLSADDMKVARAIAARNFAGENETIKSFPFVFAGMFEDGQMSQDQTLFVDDDRKAYHIYASEYDSTVHVSELTDDYLHDAGRYWRIAEKDWTEAPVVFKRNGWYYLVGSGCTGWTPNAARYYRARKISGPWQRMGNPCRGIDVESGLGPEKTWGGQSAFAFSVDGPEEGVAIVFDRWKPDNAADGRYLWMKVDFLQTGEIEIKW